MQRSFINEPDKTCTDVFTSIIPYKTILVY